MAVKDINDIKKVVETAKERLQKLNDMGQKTTDAIIKASKSKSEYEESKRPFTVVDGKNITNGSFVDNSFHSDDINSVYLKNENKDNSEDVKTVAENKSEAETSSKDIKDVSENMSNTKPEKTEQINRTEKSDKAEKQNKVEPTHQNKKEQPRQRKNDNQNAKPAAKKNDDGKQQTRRDGKEQKPYSNSKDNNSGHGRSQFNKPDAFDKDKDDDIYQKDKKSSQRSNKSQRSSGDSLMSAPQMKESRENRDRSNARDAAKTNNSRSAAYDSDRKSKSVRKIKDNSIQDGWDDDSPRSGNRMKPNKAKKQQTQQHKIEPIKIEKAVINSETITVKELSEKIGKPVAEIIKKLFGLGILATINQEIDFETCELVAVDYGIELELSVAKSFEEVLNESSEDDDDEANLVERPPVVTIMGHVDHGKTSLLDAIRNSSITDGEAGGITQHIGAYTVNCNGRSITFIDTPGHEAFTSMRARGAQVTDVVILVVAADDGIKPQTIEAINHAKAAEVPIIVAINKMDKPTANPERVKQQLTEYGLLPEEWGGETICVEVSAKNHTNLNLLLEMVLLQADVLELKANPNRKAKGTIIEAELHKSRGPLATVLVQNGTLKVGDTIVAGTAYGRVRAMMDDKGRRVTEAGPSCAVEVLGFSEVPSAGDILIVADADKLSRQVAEERKDKIKAEQIKSMQKITLDDLFNQVKEGQIKDLNIIIKADVHGSVEAVKQALEKLSNDEVRVRCIHGAVGAITESDVMFAAASNAIIIGFNVRPDSTVKAAAEREKVDIRLYRVIYNAIEDIENAMKGMFAPVYTEVELGTISVRNTFKVSGVGTIAGAYVQSGKVSRSASVRVVRDGIIIHEGKIASLKRFKDDAREVNAGYECGIGLESFNDIKEGDIIVAFVVEEVKR